MLNNEAMYIVKSEIFSLQPFVTSRSWLWYTCTAGRPNSRKSSKARGTGCHSLCHYQRLDWIQAFFACHVFLLLCHLLCLFCGGKKRERKKEWKEITLLSRHCVSSVQASHKANKIFRVKLCQSVRGRSSPKEHRQLGSNHRRESQDKTKNKRVLDHLLLSAWWCADSFDFTCLNLTSHTLL